MYRTQVYQQKAIACTKVHSGMDDVSEYTMFSRIRAERSRSLHL